MAASLKSRLARLREGGAAGHPPPLRADTPPQSDAPPQASGSGSPPNRPPPAFLSSWERIDAFLFRRTCYFPFRLDPSFDALPFVVRLGRGDAPSDFLPVVGRRPADSLRFFDFETTGLSGGAGTIAFLAATGRLEDGMLRIDQLFLGDYPGEAAFIRAFVATLGEKPILVSYNGKSFDWPLLATRCVMNGILVPEIDLHLDLVHTARRLWRPLVGSASLGDLEVPILGKDRGADLPGSEIPAVYFSYLAGGDDERLELVALHNLSDVASLAALFAKASELFAEPLAGLGRIPADCRNLGRIMLACGREDRGEALLWEAATKGDEGAALSLARRLRRKGEPKDARRALGLAGNTYERHLESARLSETLEGDLGAALHSAETAVAVTNNEGAKNRALARVRRLSLRFAEASRGRPGRTRS